MFDICFSVCVTWLWSWQKRQLWRVGRQSRTGLIFDVHYAYSSGVMVRLLGPVTSGQEMRWQVMCLSVVRCQWPAQARIRQFQLCNGRVLPRHLQGRSSQGAAEIRSVVEKLRCHQVCAHLFSTSVILSHSIIITGRGWLVAEYTLTLIGNKMTTSMNAWKSNGISSKTVIC